MDRYIGKVELSRDGKSLILTRYIRESKDSEGREETTITVSLEDLASLFGPTWYDKEASA